jgi:GAF domain-containing protein
MYQASTFQDKNQAYRAARLELQAVLEQETDTILKMATICSVLKSHLPYYFWVGFYRVNPQEPQSLMIGPYQGTLGCLHIPFSKGVCGRAARLQATQIVADVHADPAHIACDSRSASEIVVPVFSQGQLLAVLDVDATELAAFDEEDQQHLELILADHFK